MTWVVTAVIGRLLSAPFTVFAVLRFNLNPFTRRGRVLLVALAIIALIWWKRWKASRAARRALVRARWKKALESGKIIADIKRAGFQPGEFVTLSQGRVHYLLDGPEGGPVVVLLHGFGVFSYVYHQLLKPMTERGFRVLAFDFYGFGWSTANEGTTYNADLFVEQTLELVQALGMDTFTLVAHSMGGLMGALFATRYPDLVTRLMLLAPAGLPINGYSANVYMTLIHSAKNLVELPFVGDAVTKGLVKLIATQVNAAVKIGMNKRTLSYNTLCQTPRALSRVTSHLDVRKPSGRFIGMLDMTAKGLAFQQEHNPDFWRTICETLSNVDVFGDWTTTYDTLGQLHEKVPVLVLWGDQDEFLPFENCEKLLRPRLPHARFVYFADTDHFLFLNRRDEFLEEFLMFMQGKSLAGTSPDTSPVPPSVRSAQHPALDLVE